MTFLNLLGLLGLIGLLLLIIIYIIKPKYLEKIVSSSFIWKMSLKYKRKKMPFEWIKSSLLLILQVLILLTITVILMKPNLVSKIDSGEKIVILDTSASMLASDGDQTRLSRAIDDIDQLAKLTIDNNDLFTLIIAGKEAEIFAYRTDSYAFVKSKLSEVNSYYSISNIDDAMILTEDIIKINPSTDILYYTSTEFNDSGSVVIENMSQDEENVAILSFTGAYDLSLNYVFTVEVVSYGRDIEGAVLQLDTNGYRLNSTSIDLEDGVIKSFSWELPAFNEDNYDVATVKLMEIEDDFSYDNQLTYYSTDSRFSVQIVSTDTPEVVDSTREYVASALRSLTRDYDITVVSDILEAESEGYDLYIYSENVPDDLPQDGAIWIFNPLALPSSLEISVGDDIDVDNVHLSTQLSTNSPYMSILDNVTASRMTVSKYRDVSNYDSYDVLLQYNSDPILLTHNYDGLKVSIFTFGLAYSNLPILFLDFPLLIKNLSDYSVIPTFDKDVYDAGDRVVLNANPMTSSMVVTNDDGSTTYDEFPVELDVNILGTYDIEQHLSDGRVKTEHFYVRVPKSESLFDFVGSTIISDAVQQDNTSAQLKENLLDLLPYFAGLLLILLVIEWEVQYREQY